MIQQLIDEAYARGEREIVLPPGNFYLGCPIRCPEGMTISGSGKERTHVHVVGDIAVEVGLSRGVSNLDITLEDRIMTERERRIYAKAMTDVVKDRTLNTLQPIEVLNEVAAPQIEVQVDTTPLANAMLTMNEQLKANNELMSQLLVVLSEREATVVNVKTPVQNQAPAPIVNIEAPKPKRSKTKVVRNGAGDMVETITEYEY